MTTRRPKSSGPSGLEALGEIGARLGDLLGTVKATLEKAGEQSQDGEGQTEFTINTPKGPVKPTIGWRVKVGGLATGAQGSTGGAADRAEVRKEADERPAREPLVDVFVEAEHVIVTAELPGVSAKEVNLRFEGADLVIETTGATRFQATVPLPATVVRDAAPAKALRNGILELRFPTRS